MSYGSPRRVFPTVRETVYILTDASFDDSRGGLGGVLIDQQGAVLAWFSLMLDEQQVQQFIQGDAQVVIGELETLALLLLLWTCALNYVNHGTLYSRLTMTAQDTA